MNSELLARNLVLFVVLLSLGLLAYLFAAGRQVSEERGGRVLFLMGAFILPLLALGAGIARSFDSATRTEFCLSCHEMAPFAAGLEDRSSVMAVHYQNNLIPRDHACYSCHQDYGMFGDLRAKLRGLGHLYAHYFAPPRQRITLHEPFAVDNCLDCHEGARRFVESPSHQGQLANDGTLRRPGCLQGACHASAHPEAIADLRSPDGAP